MKKLLYKSLQLAIIANFLLITPINAGGGRMILMHNSTSNWGIKEDIISAQVFNEGSQQSYSFGEKMEFRIKNPQIGDHCITEQSVTDKLGLVYGTCYADSKREMEVYLYSLDRHDESSIYILHFIDPPKPSLIPSPSSIIIPRSSLSPSPSPLGEKGEKSSLKPSPVNNPEIDIGKKDLIVSQLSPLKKISYFFTSFWGKFVGYLKFIKK